MTILFETKDYGKIEVDTDKRKVYFFKDDYETDLEWNDSFHGLYGTQFQIIFVTGAITLEVFKSVEIARNVS